MSENETGNAKIIGATIELARGSILSSWIHLEFAGGSGQGFGGYSLKGPYLAAWVGNIMRVTGVEQWTDVVGKNCRFKRVNGLIAAIGHIIEDKWFVPKEVFDQMGLEKEGEK